MTNVRLWRALLVLGALLRLAVALTVTNSLDVAFFAKVAREGADLQPLYANSLFSYPPLWGLLFETIGKLLALCGQPVVVHLRALEPYVIPGLTSADLAPPVASLALKLPAMLADSLLAALLFSASRRQGASVPDARIVALAWWLNPFAILVSCVQAGWDATVPAALIAVVLLAFEKRWFAAAAVMTAGVAIKIVPIFALVFVPAFVACSLQRRRLRVRSVVAALAGAAMTAAAILIPIALWHELRAMWVAVFVRVGTFSVGGANLLAFATLRQFDAAPSWIAEHRGPFLDLVELVACGCFLAIAFLLVRARPQSLDRYWLAACGVLATLCATSPLTQPTYTLWPVPFCLLLGVRRSRFWILAGAMLTVFGATFFLSVRGIANLLVPACAFAAGCDVAALAQRGGDYWTASGPGGNTLQIFIDAMCGELIGLGIVACLIAALWQLAHPSASDALGTAIEPATRGRSWQLNVAIVALVGAIALVPLARIPQGIALRIEGHGRRAVIVSSGYSGNVYAAVASARTPQFSEIDAYFDKAYASLRGVTPQFAGGFATHLQEDLARRGEPVPVKVLDAAGLRRLLSGNRHGVALMVLGGVLPDTVRSERDDLLKSWLLGGGTVFWAGGPFDLMYAPPNAPNPAAAYEGPDYSRWRGLYGARSLFPRSVNVFAPPVVHAATPSKNWAIARIDFDRTTFALNSGPLVRRGGAPLAYIDARYNSSVSTLPLGAGRLVFFADAFNDEIHAAEVVAQLIYTSAWYDPSGVRAFGGTLAASGAPMTLTALHGGDRLRVFGGDPDYEPFAAYDVPGQVALVANGNRLVVQPESFAGNVHAVVEPPPRPLVSSIAVYADPRELGRGLYEGFQASLVSSLRDELAVRNQDASVRAIDPAGLFGLLRGAPDGTMLVVLGGVLPESVRNASTDLLQRWLENGGSVIWAGGPFDLQYARSAAGTRDVAAPENLAPPDYSKWPRLYAQGSVFPPRVNVVTPPVTRGRTPAEFWRVWRGEFDRTTFATNTGPLLKLGGYPLGFIDARVNSSVSVIPVGRGRVVFFADAFADPAEGASLIAQLLFTGVWYQPTHLREYDGTLTASGPPMTLAGTKAGDRIAVFGDGSDYSPIDFLSVTH